MSAVTADQDPALLDIEYTVEDGIEVTTLVKVAGVAVDWTSATFTAYVRRGTPRLLGTKVADLTVTGDASGNLTITLAGATTTTLGAGSWPYSIRATFSGDEPLTYVAGVLRGTLRATHA